MTKNETRIAQATGLLRQARELCKAAGAARTVARIRLAITSAEGAARHAAGAPYRDERRASGASVRKARTGAPS